MSFVWGRFFFRRHADSLLSGFAMQDEHCSYIRVAEVLFLSGHHIVRPNVLVVVDTDR